MLSTVRPTLISATVLVLAACGSSGGGEDAAPEPGGLFFGSTDPAASGNGLAFAGGGGNINNLEGQTATILIPRTIVNDGTGEGLQELFEGQITFGSGTDITLIVDGEMLNFVDGVATRDDGSIIRITELDERNSQVLLFQVLADGIDGGRIEEKEFAHFVVGFETNPDDIAVLTGTVSYVGNIDGVLLNAAGSGGASGDVTGSIDLTATFDTSEVFGDVNLVTDAAVIDLVLDPVAITGNGFAGDLTAEFCTAGTCTSNSEIGGVFMGFNATHIGGVIDLDVSIEDANGNTTDFIGNAGFIAVDPTG